MIFMNSEVGQTLGDPLHLWKKAEGSREVMSQPQALQLQDSQGPSCALEIARTLQMCVFLCQVTSVPLQRQPL